MPERLVPNSARFPDQTIDGETLLFDAETGSLLLLVGFASVLWSHLAGGASVDEVCVAVEARYGAGAASATRTFIDDLTAGGILIAAKEPAQSGALPGEWPAAFTAPAIERYDDIAKIIAMDPIHDVDITAGWPRPAPGKP